MPLIVLAVPFLDTSFVVAKRIKYRRPVYQADSNHFHHRFHRMGFSPAPHGRLPVRLDADHGQPRGALRYVPYSDDERPAAMLGWSR